MDNKVLTGALFGLKAILIVIGIAICAMIISNGDPKSYSEENVPGVELKKPTTNKQSEIDAVDAENAKTLKAAYKETMISIDSSAISGIYFTIILIVLGIAALIIFGFLGIITDVKSAIPFLGSIVLFGAIIGIAYATASGSEALPGWEDLKAMGGTKDQATKYAVYATASINSFFILIGLAILAIVAAEVNKILK